MKRHKRVKIKEKKDRQTETDRDTYILDGKSTYIVIL